MMGIMTCLPLVVLCFFLPTPSKSALRAFDCTHSDPYAWLGFESIRIYDLLPKCENIQQSESIDADLVELPPTPISAYRCRVTYIESLVDSEGSSRPVSNGTVKLGRDACLKALTEKSIELMGEFIPHLTVNGTTRHTIPRISPDAIEGHSSVTRTYFYHRSYEITLSREQGTLQWHQNILTFDQIDCDYENFTCEDDFYGELFWRPDFDRDAGTKLYSGNVHLVSMQKTLFTTPEVTYAVIIFQDKILAIRGLDNVTADETVAFRSEVENVYIMPHGGTLIRPRLILPAYESPRGAPWANVYSEEAPSSWSQAWTNAVDVVKRLCDEKKIKLFRYLESLAPPSPAIDFPQKGVIATKIYKKEFNMQFCTEKVVYRRKSTQCFKEMTVTDAGNKSLFLDPYTRKLTTRAVEIDCNRTGMPQNKVTLTDSLLGVTTELPVLKNTSPMECSNHDWVKIVALTLLSIWLLAIFVRVIRYFVRYFSQKTMGSKEPQTDPDIEQQKRAFVGNGSFHALSAVTAMLKPPLTR